MKNMGNSHSIPSKSWRETERGGIIAFPFQKEERGTGALKQQMVELFRNSEQHGTGRIYRRHDTVNEN